MLVGTFTSVWAFSKYIMNFSQNFVDNLVVTPRCPSSPGNKQLTIHNRWSTGLRTSQHSTATATSLQYGLWWNHRGHILICINLQPPTSFNCKQANFIFMVNHRPSEDKSVSPDTRRPIYQLSRVWVSPTKSHSRSLLTDQCVTVRPWRRWFLYLRTNSPHPIYKHSRVRSYADRRSVRRVIIVIS